METRTVSRLDPKPAVTLTSHQLVRFDASQCLPEKTELLEHAISDRQRLSPRLQKDVTHVLSEAPALLQPTAVLSMLNVDLGELTHISKLPPRLLARIDRAFGVVCTIGPELEAHSSQYFEGHQYTRGYLLDRIGTLAVARLARRSAGVIREEHHMMRWAPGDACDDWSLSGQALLFDQVPAHLVGVRLNAHNVMVPTKSLSFVLLAGKGLNRSACTIACSRCVWNGSCDDMDGSRKAFDRGARPSLGSGIGRVE